MTNNMEILLKLFAGFLKVGLFSVGGGYAAIPLIQSQIVDNLQLLTIEEFADLVTIAEMTPGPISINSATFVGNRLTGINGALICTLGVIIPSFIICLLLAKIYYKYKGLSSLQLVLASLRPAVVSLIASAGLAILTTALLDVSKFKELINLTTFSNFKVVELLLFIVCFGIIRKFKTSPIIIIFASGVVGTIAYYLINLVSF